MHGIPGSVIIFGPRYESVLESSLYCRLPSGSADMVASIASNGEPIYLHRFVVLFCICDSRQVHENDMSANNNDRFSETCFSPPGNVQLWHSSHYHHDHFQTASSSIIPHSSEPRPTHNYDLQYKGASEEGQK